MFHSSKIFFWWVSFLRIHNMQISWVSNNKKRTKKIRLFASYIPGLLEIRIQCVACTAKVYQVSRTFITSIVKAERNWLTTHHQYVYQRAKRIYLYTISLYLCLDSMSPGVARKLKMCFQINRQISLSDLESFIIFRNNFLLERGLMYSNLSCLAYIIVMVRW